MGRISHTTIDVNFVRDARQWWWDAFEEAKHHRAANGEFGSGSGSSKKSNPAKVQAVKNLYLRAGTPGEKAAAKAALERMGEKAPDDSEGAKYTKGSAKTGTKPKPKYEPPQHATEMPAPKTENDAKAFAKFSPEERRVFSRIHADGNHNGSVDFHMQRYKPNLTVKQVNYLARLAYKYRGK